MKGKTSSSSFGLINKIKMDVFVFDNNEDYYCYVEAVNMWVEHLEVRSCDFVGKEGVVHEQVEEWSSSDQEFLSKE